MGLRKNNLKAVPAKEEPKSLHERYPELSDDHESQPPTVIKKEEGEGPWIVSYADLMTLLMGFFAMMYSMSKPDVAKLEQAKKANTERFGGHYEEPYKDLENALKKTLKANGLEKQVQIESGYDGVTMTFTGTLFFESGDFHVKEEAVNIVNKLAGTIQKDAKGYNIKIEGHTDSAPISHPIIASNWELSGLRAARIAQLFETNGFARKQLSMIGMGDTKPIVPNENTDGTPNLENRSKNRRVVIKVFKEVTE
ncbi:flagellar motor protein MotB [Bdellovibrio sp. KM01]|uniref:OmpA/MotB family protein n=1 Tax=Bdellovibrio sp. KM01 TaxID=2748865 RepID=UPI0015E9DE02|nr:flagellar motor protein MotB [Bdellovibrio sp. KM01]QLY24260.1 flagellar motor protein MotB [Bdellovibrio sp. KM01]